jgi:ribosome recycling factor
MDEVKKKQKEGEIPEDDAHKLTEDIQRVTDDYIEKIEETLEHKEEEIMEV